MTESISPEAQIKAVATLARSNLLAMAFKWAVIIGTPIITALGGWATAKLDTKSDIESLRESVQHLSTQQETLHTDFVAAIPAIQQQMTGIQRDVVISTAAAIAYETETRSKQKLDEGERLAEVFDGYITRGERPALSAKTVIATIAVQHTSR
jgi:hypothetical protein